MDHLVKFDTTPENKSTLDCIVCFRQFEYYENRVPESEKVCKIFSACSNYLKPEVFTNSSNWECIKSPDKVSPFCSECFTSGEELSFMDDSLTEIQQKIESFVENFTNEILSYRNEKASLFGTPAPTIKHEILSAEPTPSLIKEEKDPDGEIPYDSDNVFLPSPNSAPSDFFDESSETHLEKNTNEEKESSLANTEKKEPKTSETRTNRMQLRKVTIPVERLQYTELHKRRRQGSGKPTVKANITDNDSGSAFESASDESCSDESSWSGSNGKNKIPRKRRKTKNRRKCHTDSSLKNIKCEKCDFITNRKDTLRFHVLHKHTEFYETFDCEFCGLKMKSEKAFKQHIKQHNRAFTCEDCGQVFNKRNKLNQYDYEIHCLSHKHEIPYECQICHEKFSNINNFCNHQKFSSCGKSGMQLFECEICHTKFYFKYLLLLHHLDHNRRKRSLEDIECEICGKVYKNDKHKYGRLEPHYLLHTKECALSCDICGMPVNEKSGLNHHRKTHKAYYKETEIPCEECGKTFNSKKYLNSHIQYKHSSSSERFTCEICWREFKIKKVLRSHIKEHFKEFTCEKCGEKFDGDGAPNQYNYEIHCLQHRNEIPYECQLCHEKFSNVNNYCKHQKFSSCGKSEMEVLNCDSCSKKFYYKYLLLLHEMDHTREKLGVGNVQCSICGKQYLNNKERVSKLESHYLFHTKECPLTCDICLMPIRDKTTMNQHRQTHKVDYSEPEFNCEHCSKSFSSQKNLNSHVEIKHTESKERFTCEICQKVFRIRKIYKQHIKTHSTSLPCEICGKTFNAVGALNMHRRIHTGEFTCRECDLKCKTENTLKIHISVVHRKEKRFVCEMCGHGYYYLTDYNLHMKRHSEKQSFNCEFCGGKFTREYDFKIHMRIHTGKGLDSSDCPYICDVCGKQFKYQQSLKQHHDTHHSGVAVEFKCDQCNKTFNRKDSLLGHVKRTHGEKVDLNLPCEVCGGKYKNERALKQHMKQHTVAIPCGICEKTFHTPAQVKVHRRQHTGELFPCDKCERQFSSAACLKSHVSAVHLKIVRHFCEICGKGFYKRTGYLGHLETHSDQKTCQCKECGEWFNTRHKLSDHKRKMHTGESFDCEPCGKTFLRKATLRLHIKKRHNKNSLANGGKQAKLRNKRSSPVQNIQQTSVVDDINCPGVTPSSGEDVQQSQPLPVPLYHGQIQAPGNYNNGGPEGIWWLGALNK